MRQILAHMRPVPEIAIVVPESALLSGLGAFLDTFDAVNRYARTQYGQVDVRVATMEVLRVSTLGIGPTRPRLGNGVSWPVDGALPEHLFDIVVVTRRVLGEPDAAGLGQSLS